MQTKYFVYKYHKDRLIAIAAVSGLGRNKGTLDHTHSKRTAQKWARHCNKTEKNKKFIYRAEPSY